MTQCPLCFVIMPFGSKPDPSTGLTIDFDRVYAEGIEPGIRAAGMEPIRADEERTGGIIHKPMFERLLLCDFAVADLTTANANVFYELGVRHTARPATTLTLFAKNQRIPFDVNFLRSLPYDLGADNAFGEDEAQGLRAAVTARLTELRTLAADQGQIDSPLFQLLSEWKPGDLAHLKTDVFRDRVQANEELKAQLARIRELGRSESSRSTAEEELAQFRTKLGPLDGVEAATAVDLMLTCRALEDWDGMISVAGEMPEVLRRQVLVREQLGFAYNRRAGKDPRSPDRAEALKILTAVADQQGPSSETLGLIGRIHKDEWLIAQDAGSELEARGHLKKAIDAYRRGFLADQRDAYPGINLLTLLDIDGQVEERDRFLPIVSFAVERKIAGATADYWDHATLLELAVLAEDRERAFDCLSDALAVVRETWEPGTTANNLKMIERSRKARGAETAWLVEVIAELEKRAK